MMKSGFLISGDPNVSFLSEKPKESDTTLGSRKYKYEDFDFNRNIGNGNFSAVWQVNLKSDPSRSFAIKSYNIKTVTSKNQHLFVKQERAALLHLNSPGHKNVIKLFDTFRDESYVYLIYECAEVELWELVKHCGSIFDDLARHFIIQIIDGLEYIHSKGIVHRDLKCENIVISKGTLKIIDFGSSKFYTDSTKTDFKCSSDTTECSGLPSNDFKGTPNTVNQIKFKNSDQNTGLSGVSGYRKNRRSRFFENYVGTPNFMDPKSVSNKDSGFRRDFWSIGCVIYQILCGRPPFYGSTEYFVLKRIKQFDLVFPDCINSDAKNLIKILLNPDENEKISFQLLREHPFLNTNLNSVNFKELLDQSSQWREICFRIGDMIIELTKTRSTDTTREFEQKFDEYIRNLKDSSKNFNIHVMDRLVDLMFWSLEETKREIVNETLEADKWLS